jgi:hypothetical protein
MIIAEKALDKKLHTILKSCAAAGSSGPVSEKEKAANLVSSFCSAFSDLEFLTLIKTLTNFYLTRRRMKEIGQELEFPMEGFLQLGHNGFSEAAGFGFSDQKEALAALPIGRLLEGGVPAKTLGAVAKGKKEISTAALDYFAKNPDAADTSSAADWIFSTATPKQLLPFLMLLFSKKQRKAHLRSYIDLAGDCLVKDKSALLLKECLSAISIGTLNAEELLRLMLSRSNVAVQLIQIIGNSLSEEHSPIALHLLDELLLNLLQYDTKDRLIVSSSLAILGTHVLLQKIKKPQAEQILALLVAARMKLLKMPAELRKGIWVFIELNEIDFKDAKDSPNELISFEGAEFFTDLLQEEISDSKVRESIETVAFNLGIKPIGLTAESAVFNPDLHEDTVGGLFRNDQVTVLTPGWLLGDRTVVRAKVKPYNE